MSQSVALLVGGTKILERALQTALPVEVVIVATMEEATKVMGERDVALAVLGPTLRRALAMVATLRREGADYPRLIVVYRDDQRDEVKRHQRGKAVADGYVPLSRIAKELAPMAQAQWHEGTRGQPGANAAPLAVGGAVADDVIDEVEVEAFEVNPEGSTREMDVLPPLDDAGPAVVAPAVHEGPQELDLSDVVEVLDENGLEELPAAAVEEEAPIEELSADEIVAEELIEEISSDELISENVTHAAQAAVAAVDATATPAAAVEPVEEVPESALEEPTPDAVRPSSTPRSLQVVARIDEAAQEAANAVAVAAPAQADPGAAAPTGATRPQLGAYAMLGELTGFVERLQEASQLIHQLEGENVQLRQQVARLKEVARPELVADLGTEQQKAKDLQLRLEGAERARDAAVEARTKFEQQAGALREEIEAGKAREAALEAQLEARRRIAQDAAKSLRAIGQMLEG
jgi:hypothetical protein